MPDEMMEKWLEYYDENGLSWLDTAVQAAIKQAFFAGGEAVEQMRAADVCNCGARDPELRGDHHFFECPMWTRR